VFSDDNDDTDSNASFESRSPDKRKSFKEITIVAEDSEEIE
jgi:hypothetical protein